MLVRWLQDSSALRQAARRAQRGIAEVRGAFSRAGSLRELLGTLVAQGREAVAQAWAMLRLLLTALWLEDAAGTATPRTPLPHPQT